MIEPHQVDHLRQVRDVGLHDILRANFARLARSRVTLSLATLSLTTLSLWLIDHWLDGSTLMTPTSQEASTLDMRSDYTRVVSAPEALHLWERARKATVKPRCALRGQASVKLLDARDLAPRYYWSHAPQAIHTPWRLFTRGRRSGELLEPRPLIASLRSLGICPQDRVLIYGDWSRGWGEEARMLWLLEYAGHERVSVIEGGWRAWRQAGGPRERGAQREVKASDWEVSWRRELRADTETVAGLIKRGVISLDARSREEFMGATPYGSAVGGRLEHSVHLPWRALLDDDDHLHTPERLRALFAEYGVTAESPVFTYCTGGIRSAFVYLALREAGFQRAMNYDGSWWAWSEHIVSREAQRRDHAEGQR